MTLDMHDHLVSIGDTRLFVSERGSLNNYPLIVLHGGPGLDHHMFGDYLDALADHYRLTLVDQRAQGQSEPDLHFDQDFVALPNRPRVRDQRLDRNRPAGQSRRIG